MSLDFAPAAGLCPDCGHGWAWFDYDEGQEQCRHPVVIAPRGRECEQREVCGCRTDFIEAAERPPGRLQRVKTRS